MKTLLTLVCAFFLAAHADAASRYAGKYFALSYQRGILVAGINITVDDDGTLTGRGTYLDFTEIDLTGTVSSTGVIALTETDDRKPFHYTARFTPNGKKFTAKFSGGDVLRGKKLTGSFPQAGVYSYEDDFGEDGVVMVNKNGLLYGVIYDLDGNGIELDGTADAAGFSSNSVDGVAYDADFDGDDFVGTYDDGRKFYGDFDGSKY